MTKPIMEPCKGKLCEEDGLSGRIRVRQGTECPRCYHYSVTGETPKNAYFDNSTLGTYQIR